MCCMCFCQDNDNGRVAEVADQEDQGVRLVVCNMVMLYVLTVLYVFLAGQ